MKYVIKEKNEVYNITIEAGQFTITHGDKSHTWRIRTGKNYVYRFFKKVVWTEDINMLSRHFEKLQTDNLFICRFDAIIRNFGL